MKNKISLVIDGKICVANEGEYILNIARANDIFIPAICYLTRCSPTLACRLCLVEADGKQIYACNAKAKDGMQIVTTTPNIVAERRAIMEVYNVNHPLQCGVCDKSGECELQNNTLIMQVNEQNYSIKDTHKPTQKWGVMKYDPSLCIVCEKCVTVCKDMIGSNALSTVKRDSDPLDKTYKDNMPKDAYAMWNKLNKSLIGFEEDKCISCGECISVCPVGAMADASFQYSSNAWELKKIPASNPFSSDCSQIYYEVKHNSIFDNSLKIYRITNESHYTSLNGATRFGFDFANTKASKDESVLSSAVEAFKKAKNILFDSYITNEEAYILEELRKKLSLNLVNEDAQRFQEFLNSFKNSSGTSLYNGDLNDIHNSNFVISIGSFLKTDAPSVKYALNNAINVNKACALYFHTIDDLHIQNLGKKGKNIETITYKPLNEEAILFLILDLFGENLPEELSNYINSQKVLKTKVIIEKQSKKVIEKIVEDGVEKELEKTIEENIEKSIEYSSSNFLEFFGENEQLLDTIELFKDKKDKFSLIIGEDLIHHPNSQNLANLCGLIQKYTKFKVVVIPPQTNSLGVSQICELSSKQNGYTIGYNQKADFKLCALGYGNIDIPVLNQQEGTFTSINKRVVPTNVALPYNGYTLNDIANKIFEEEVEYTIDYTPLLPQNKGFKNILFDDLPNEFKNDRQENRGYLLNTFENLSNDNFEPFRNMEIIEDIVIYKANPINQFNQFTKKALNKDEMGLYISKTLLEKLDLNNKDKVLVQTKDDKIELNIFVDETIINDIAYIPYFDDEFDVSNLFLNSRYCSATIKKV